MQLPVQGHFCQQVECRNQQEDAYAQVACLPYHLTNDHNCSDVLISDFFFDVFEPAFCVGMLKFKRDACFIQVPGNCVNDMLFALGTGDWVYKEDEFMRHVDAR
jgi:hypothetical protein